MRVFPPNQHQAIRLGVGQRAEQHAVNHAENRRVGADTQSQRDDGSQCEAWFLRQHSKAIAEVLPEIFEPSHAPRVATTLLRLLDSTESLASRVARLLRIHPRPDVLLGLSLDVIAQLLVKFALHL